MQAAPGAVPAVPAAVQLIAAEKTYANGTQALLPVDLSVAEGDSGESA